MSKKRVAYLPVAGPGCMPTNMEFVWTFAGGLVCWLMTIDGWIVGADDLWGGGSWTAKAPV